MKNFLVLLLTILSFTTLQAQNGRPDASRRVQMERDSVLSKVPDLSEDQKLIIVSLYEGYETSLKALMEGDRTDRMAFRQKLLEASREKNQMMKEVLDEDQYKVFESYLQEERERRMQRRNQRGQGRRGQRDTGSN